MPLFTPGTTFETLVGRVIFYIDNVVFLLIGLAIIFFFYGVVKFVRNPGKADGRQNMVWSLIAIFVMVSFVGIVRILMNTFSIG